MALRAIVGSVLLAAAATAQAADPTGWYGGVSLGRAPSMVEAGAWDPSVPGCGSTPAQASVVCQEFGRKAHLGYDFSNGLAVEARYADLGKAKASVTTAASLAGGLSGDARSAGLNLDLLGNLAVARDLALVGKVGLMFADAGADGAGNVSLSDSWRHALPGVGLGLNYSLARSLGLRAAWEKYYRLGTADASGRGDVDQLMLGVDLKFR